MNLKEINDELVNISKRKELIKKYEKLRTAYYYVGNVLECVEIALTNHHALFNLILESLEKLRESLSEEWGFKK